MFLVQWVLKQKQLKEFYKHYNIFIKEGNVLVGRYKGIAGGGISLLQLNNQGMIEKAVIMKGASAFGRFKNLPELQGTLVEEIANESFNYMKKHERRSLENALDNWEKTKTQEVSNKESL
jgi:DNA-binding transcriptional regulator of glucitol operon